MLFGAKVACKLCRRLCLPRVKGGGLLRSSSRRDCAARRGRHCVTNIGNWFHCVISTITSCKYAGDHWSPLQCCRKCKLYCRGEHCSPAAPVLPVLSGRDTAITVSAGADKRLQKTIPQSPSVTAPFTRGSQGCTIVVRQFYGFVGTLRSGHRNNRICRCRQTPLKKQKTAASYGLLFWRNREDIYREVRENASRLKGEET